MKSKQIAEGLTFAICLVAVVMLASASASASIDNLGMIRQNSCIQLPQSCVTCSYNNISSVQYPDKTYALFGSYAMDKTGSNYNLTFCNTSQTGVYSVSGFGDKDGSAQTFSYWFEVTPTGIGNTTPQVIIYAILLTIIFAFLGVCSYGFYKIPSENIKTQDGELMKINWKKYLKWTCGVFIYISVVWIFYISWNLSFAFGNFSTMTNIFKMLFRFLMIASVPILITSVILGFVYWIKDKKLNEMLERGLTVYDK